MIKNAIFSSCLLIAFGCGKVNQLKETEVSFHIEDVSSGELNKKVYATLFEYETSSVPFTPISRTSLEVFELDIDEVQSYSFKANRGHRFSYVLEFIRNDESYTSGNITNGMSYEIVEECTLKKKEPNECALKIEPTCDLFIRAINVGEMNENDSIWISFYDGFHDINHAYKGMHSSPTSDLDVAHGFYILTKEVYSAGALQYIETEEVELKHNETYNFDIEF